MTEHSFINGQEVEVASKEEGYEDSWFKATIIRSSNWKKTNFLVEYQSLLDDKGLNPLREFIHFSQIRPLPPKENTRIFQLNDEIDAFFNDGWWKGSIIEVLDDLRYTVYFRNTKEKMDFDQSQLRSHLEWIDGRWVSSQEKGMVEPVEVILADENCRGAWFPATVLKEISDKLFLVQCKNMGFGDEVRQLREIVDTLHIRPRQPDISDRFFFYVMEKVDAFYDFGWWSGVITKVLANDRYIVFFKHHNKEKEFSQSDLRRHMDWIDGKWFLDSREFVAHSQGRVHSPDPTCISAPSSDMATQFSPSAARDNCREKSPSSPRNLCGKRDSSQSTPKETILPSNGVYSSQEKIKQSVLESNAELIRPCKKVKNGEAAKAAVSMKSRRVRGMSIGSSAYVKAQHEISFSVTKGKRNVEVDNSEFIGLPKPHLQSQTKQHMILRSPRQTKKPSDGIKVKLQRGVNTQMVKVFKRKGGWTKDSGKKRKILRRGKLEAVALGTRCQSAGSEHETANKERKDVQGECSQSSSHIAEEHQSPSVFFENSNSRTLGGNKGPEHEAASKDMKVVQTEGIQPLNHLTEEHKPEQQPGSMCLEKPISPILKDNGGVGRDERAHQSFLVDVTTTTSTSPRQPGEGPVLRENSSLPFIKSSPLWESVTSIKVFQLMPQQPHFRPLEQYNEDLREGIAIGNMLNFANLVEKTFQAQFDEPRSMFENKLKALVDLEELGFTVQPVQTRLEELLRIKDMHCQLNDMSKTVESEILEEEQKKERLETEIDELTESITRLNMKLQTLVLEKDVKGSNIGGLQRQVDAVRDSIRGARLRFDSIVAAPW